MIVNSGKIVNSGVFTDITEQLVSLYCIPAGRIRQSPRPGTATIDDLVHANDVERRTLCELVDGTLVEKPVGFFESMVAGTVIALLRQFVQPRKLGVVTGPDGMFSLRQGLVMGPDVAFLSFQRMGTGVPAKPAYPFLAPDLVVEVLSPTNSKAEMHRKRKEYFRAGVVVVWMIDLPNRSVAIFTSPDDSTILGEQEELRCEQVLPGFVVRVSEFFSDLDSLPKG